MKLYQCYILQLQLTILDHTKKQGLYVVVKTVLPPDVIVPLAVILPVVEILDADIAPACVVEAVCATPLYTDRPAPVVASDTASMLPLSITADPYDPVIVVPFEFTCNEFVLYAIFVPEVLACREDAYVKVTLVTATEYK